MPPSFTRTRSRRALGLASLGGALWFAACGGHSSGPSSPVASAGGPSRAGGASSGASGATAGGRSEGGASGAGAGGTAGAATLGGGAGASPNGGRSAGTAGAGAGAGGSSGNSGRGGAGGSSEPTSLPAAPIAASDIIQFNDNGAWNWFQDERAVIDAAHGKFVIGSVASGGTRNGNVEAVVYDVATQHGARFTLGVGLASVVDDHNSPAFLVRPDGKYFAMWSGHRTDCFSRHSIFDGASWSAEALFDWAPVGCPWSGASTNLVTYSNPWYVGGAIFSAVRSVFSNPAWLTSNDDGSTLSYYGPLVTSGQLSDVGGYYKFWGNNSDRIDFVGTQAHPRDVDNSLWHGYFKGGKLYDSKDQLIEAAGGNSAPAINQFSKVVATGTVLGNVPLGHLWNHDIVRYPDGTIAVLGQGRVTGSDTNGPDLRLIYARFNGSTWKATYLGKAGPKLTADEQDYTGLGALHPETPNRIFISTTVDPRDDTTQLAKHEIFEGETRDDGSTWTWAPLTEGSTVDNLRPVVPKWDANHTLLLWLRGTYVTAQYYSLAVVGATAGL